MTMPDGALLLREMFGITTTPRDFGNYHLDMIGNLLRTAEYSFNNARLVFDVIEQV